MMKARVRVIVRVGIGFEALTLTLALARTLTGKFKFTFTFTFTLICKFTETFNSRLNCRNFCVYIRTDHDAEIDHDKYCKDHSD